MAKKREHDSAGAGVRESTPFKVGFALVPLQRQEAQTPPSCDEGSVCSDDVAQQDFNERQPSTAHFHQLLESSPLLTELDAQCRPFLDAAYARHVHVFDELLARLTKTGPVERIGRDAIIRGEIDVYSEYIDSHLAVRKYLRNFPKSEELLEPPIKFLFEKFNPNHGDKNSLIEYYKITLDEYHEKVNDFYGLFLSILGEKSDAGVDALSLEERVEQLNAHIRRHPGQEMTLGFLSTLFPELRIVDPKQSTASGREHVDLPMLKGQNMRWTERVGKVRGQDPIPFLREQYAVELEIGMTIGQLRMRDDLLGRAVERWAQKHPLPDDLKLDMRTRQQRNDDDLRQVEQARLEGQEVSFSEREEKRLKQAERRRSK